MKFQRILIAIDDSKYSENAAEYGFAIAHTYNAQVALVHITEPVIMSQPTDPSMVGSIMPAINVDGPEIVSIQQEYSSKLIENTIKRLGGDLQVTQFNEFGSTADAILECVAKFNADLVVLGTHSRTGLDRFFMGSISEDVVRHSSVPVLVVPLHEEEK
ncbi:universal stress protein [Mucilaginibacter sp. AW1-3]